MDTTTFGLLTLLILLAAYTMTLYHRAHGSEKKSVEMGAKIVLEALRRDGRISGADNKETDVVRAVNIGEELYTDTEQDKDESEIPDIIVARSKKHADQIGDRLSEDLMKNLDKII